MRFPHRLHLRNLPSNSASRSLQHAKTCASLQLHCILLSRMPNTSPKLQSSHFLFIKNERSSQSVTMPASHQIHNSSYDLFASEARLAVFLAIAHGDLPLQSWFRLEREQAYAAGQFLPFSWTGTAFEYLMPGLWMCSYRGTLVARTESACVHVQRAFGRSLGIPWGISESGARSQKRLVGTIPTMPLACRRLHSAQMPRQAR